MDGADAEPDRNSAFAKLAERVAATRDRQAFAVLFDHYAPRIKAYLLRLGADTGTAEELTQEVMVTLWRKAALFDPSKSSLGTWLFRIARNRRIDAVRRRRGELDPHEPMLQPSAPEEADTGLDAQLREERMRAALRTLPEEQAVVVQLAFFRGLSHSEVAAETGLPLGTVKSRIRLAFTRLRRIIEADEAIDID